MDGTPGDDVLPTVFNLYAHGNQAVLKQGMSLSGGGGGVYYALSPSINSAATVIAAIQSNITFGMNVATYGANASTSPFGVQPVTSSVRASPGTTALVVTLVVDLFSQPIPTLNDSFVQCISETGACDSELAQVTLGSANVLVLGTDPPGHLDQVRTKPNTIFDLC